MPSNNFGGLNFFLFYTIQDKNRHMSIETIGPIVANI